MPHAPPFLVCIMAAIMHTTSPYRLVCGMVAMIVHLREGLNWSLPA